jgi:hypothetical protein
MDFLMMMRYGDIQHKAAFVFDLISQAEPYNSITFAELVIFYFKVIDEFGNSEDPDLLINEDFGEYTQGNMDDKEVFLKELDHNLVASISLTDVFFNLIRVDLMGSISKPEFIEFMSMYPRTMDLFNFIDISDKDFKNIQSINKTNQYLEVVLKIITDLENVMGTQHKIANVSKVHKTVRLTNFENILDKVDIIQKEIEHSIDQSMHSERQKKSYKNLKNSSKYIFHKN